MAEINNSLAASINSQPVDLGKTLLTIGQLNALRTRSALEEASTANVQQETYQKQSDLRGRAANEIYNDPSDEGVQRAFEHWENGGAPLDSLTKQRILAMPPAQRRATAAQIRSGAMPSSTNMEATGEVTRNQGQYIPQGIPPNEPITNRTAAATGGPSQAQVDNAINTRRNFDGSPRVTSTADIVGTPQIVRNPDGSISSNITPETTATQTSLAQDYAGYRDSAKNAAMTKYVLKNMADDADRLSTGKGATFTNNAKQWIQSAQTIPGVGSVVKSITGDISDPIAAFEALQKNAGQLTRATLKDVDGKAASEYQMIQRQLPNAEMSPRGLKLVTSQLIAPEDYKQAKLQAADNWKKANRGSLGGFEADWNKNISPSTFLFARLPAADRDTLIKNLNKTDTGRAQLQAIKRQAQWAHDNGLDEFID